MSNLWWFVGRKISGFDMRRHSQFNTGMCQHVPSMFLHSCYTIYQWQRSSTLWRTIISLVHQLHISLQGNYLKPTRRFDSSIAYIDNTLEPIHWGGEFPLNHFVIPLQPKGWSDLLAPSAECLWVVSSPNRSNTLNFWKVWIVMSVRTRWITTLIPNRPTTSKRWTQMQSRSRSKQHRLAFYSPALFLFHFVKHGIILFC